MANGQDSIFKEVKIMNDSYLLKEGIKKVCEIKIFNAGIDEDYINKYLRFFDVKSFPTEQLDILQEDCAELIQAISKYKRGKIDFRSNIIEKMSHICTSIAVVSCILNIDDAEIKGEIFKKREKYNI